MLTFLYTVVDMAFNKNIYIFTDGENSIWIRHPYREHFIEIQRSTSKLFYLSAINSHRTFSVSRVQTWCMRWAWLSQSISLVRSSWSCEYTYCFFLKNHSCSDTIESLFQKRKGRFRQCSGIEFQLMIAKEYSILPT